MASIHAWFSAATALIGGSSLYRKPSGSTVNVTRVNADFNAKGPHPYDEKYVGEVISSDTGGLARGLERVRGITH